MIKCNDNTVEILTLNFHEDPGHAWVEVPMEIINKLGIADKISSYSYMCSGRAYLEEDCDAAVLFDALDARAMPWTTKRLYREFTPIREFARFSA